MCILFKAQHPVGCPLNLVGYADMAKKHEQSSGVQDVQDALIWALQSLLRHVCMARKDSLSGSDGKQLLGQRLQLAALHCLKLIMSAASIHSWSSAWAEVWHPPLQQAFPSEGTHDNALHKPGL